ncbi:hypothetical protein BGZ60DRAFT_510060 [Tricladium varicosporioides]|nr:hypothetical protein BGZ60DRAFT_510060 [Hymenoscyphus varicosporioides]
MIRGSYLQSNLGSEHSGNISHLVTSIYTMILTPFKVNRQRGTSSRKPHFKVRTGCGMCKARHLKCDETRPACKKCAGAGYDCDGYDTSLKKTRKSKTHAQSRELAIIPALNQVKGSTEEKASFDFFQGWTSKELSVPFDAKFWKRAVLQISHSEPTIWHSMLALSSAHQCTMFIDENGNIPASRRHRAVEYYTKALGLLANSKTSSQLSLELVLVNCVIFVFLEIFLGNNKGAMRHLQSGTKIMNNYRAQKSKKGFKQRLNEDSLIERGIAPLIATMSLHAHENMTDDEPNMNSSQPVDEHPYDPPPEMGFTNYDEARLYLLGVMPEVQQFTRASEHWDKSTQELKAPRQEYLLSLLSAWSKSLEPLQAVSAISTQLAGLEIFRLLQVKASIFLSTAFSTSELKYDTHVSAFEDIISSIERLISPVSPSNTGRLDFALSHCFTLLNTTIIKCRNPRIRERAMKLLRLTPVRNAFWDIRTQIELLERVVRIEEGVGFEGEEVRDAYGEAVVGEWGRLVRVGVLEEDLDVKRGGKVARLERVTKEGIREIFTERFGA